MKKIFICLFMFLLLAANAEADQVLVTADFNDVYTDGVNVSKNDVVMMANTDKVYVGGVKTEINENTPECRPVIRDSVKRVPLRFLGNTLGYEVIWNDVNKSIVLNSDKNTIEAKTGENNIVLNGKRISMKTPVMIYGDTSYFPIDSIEKCFGKKVYEDENGLIVITDEEKVFDAKAYIDKYYGYESKNLPFPYEKNEFRWCMTSAERRILLLTDEEREKEVKEYKSISTEQLENKIKSVQAGLVNIVTRPDHERISAILGLMYYDNKDEDAAKRAITILYECAVSYDSIPKTGTDHFFGMINQTPGYCVYAYNLVYNSPYWDELSQKKGTDAKKEVEKWFKKVFDAVYDANVNRYINNLGGFWIKHLAGMATVTNDPYRMREIILTIDNAMSQNQWHFDGMWTEGTVSYGQQIAGNINEAIKIIDIYNDPEGFTDNRLGLTLDNNSIENRWPIIAKMMSLTQNLKFPDGSMIAMNDTHHIRTVDKSVDDPIKTEYLRNTELNNFGFYAMKYGNKDEAQQVNLKFAPLAAGLPYSAGHYHGDELGFSMWSAGMELLPDGGYVFNTQANRYFHMHAILHNCSWVYVPEAADYNKRPNGITKPNVLAYDPGEASGKQVQLIEASQPMTDEDKIDMKRRMIMLIATDENHSYTVDVQRLKGGTVHENYLRQVEEEDVILDTTLKTEKKKGTLGDYFRGEGLTGGLSMDAFYITEPEGVKTSEDFKFSWTGKDTGSVLDAYIKGVDNSYAVFSKFPTMRRVANDPSVKDNYPGYHFTQRADVSPDDITLFAGVYEGHRKDEVSKIKKVEWIDTDNPMTALVKVETDKYIDYIYVSDNKKEALIDNIAFSGEYAVLRTEKSTGKAVWKYLYGDGEIRYQDKSLKGYENYKLKVLEVENGYSGSSLKLKGNLPLYAPGFWGHSTLGDGSGFAYKITDVKDSIVKISTDSGFELTDGGTSPTYFPRYLYEDRPEAKIADVDYSRDKVRVIRGDAWFELKTPRFSKDK